MKTMLFSILILVTTGSIGADHSNFSRGEVYLIMTKQGDLLIYVDEAQGARGTDGYVDKAYHLQFAEEGLHSLEPEYAWQTLIQWKEGSIAITNVDSEQTIEFFLPEVSDKRAKNSGTGETVALQGIGLATYDFPVGELLMTTAVEGGGLVVGGCDGSCDAGGPGSTSCSVAGCGTHPTTCTVSCSAPYYTCCACKGFTEPACCRCISPS